MSAELAFTIVSMPWCAASRPNLSAGVVSALAAGAGWQTAGLDANLLMAARIGAEPYELLAESPGLYGVLEHVFAVDMFGREALGSDSFLGRYSDSGAANAFERLRDEIVPEFLDDCLERVLEGDPAVVGFTCTFNQVFASLALARRLKAARPRIRTMIGGACVHGRMGETYATAFKDVIDHVFLGEADLSLPLVLRQLAAGEPVAASGVTNGGAKHGASAPTADMSRAPRPDYDAYFALRAELVTAGATLPDVSALPFESSRGCWWGAKQHCTFCGLNNEGMAYRSKRPAHVAREIAELSSRYGMNRLMAADNIITHAEFDGLLSAIGGLRADLELFYECKANLDRDDLARLADAGVRWIQPGIESFSDNVLRLMRKGSTGLQNVALLRLCAEFGVTVSYNILFGFPGEAVEDYADTVAIIDRIRHLPPPSGEPSLVQVHRFSPFFDDPARFGFRHVRPSEWYERLTPPGYLDPYDIAYFFEREVAQESPWITQGAAVREAVQAWTASDAKIHLSLGAGFIEHVREVEGAVERADWRGASAAVLLYCDRVRSRAQVDRLIERLEPNPGAARAIVPALEQAGLLLLRNDLALTVAPFRRAKTSQDLRDWADRWLPRTFMESWGTSAPPAVEPALAARARQAAGMAALTA